LAVVIVSGLTIASAEQPQPWPVKQELPAVRLRGYGTLSGALRQADDASASVLEHAASSSRLANRCRAVYTDNGCGDNCLRVPSPCPLPQGEKGCGEVVFRSSFSGSDNSATESERAISNMNTKIIGSIVAVIGLATTARAADLELKLRSRVERPETSPRFHVVTKTEKWDPHKTAVVICDMWDHHWCKDAEARVGEMAPRMNEVVSKLRDQGVLIIHCPGETMKFYADDPARKATQAAPHAEPMKRRGPVIAEGPFPITDSDGGCSDEHSDIEHNVWTREIATLEIKPIDGISDKGDEVYNFMRQKGVENVVMMGVHTNMCVLRRPYAIRAFVNKGLRVALMRDMTDSMYNPKMPPHVDHFSGTDLVIEFIEKYWCPTLTSDQIIGGEPFRFAADKRTGPR
jgi:nicotinamidase-related amidase